MKNFKATSKEVIRVLLNDFNFVNKNFEDLYYLLQEVISGYIFWSFFCGLGPSIWFYPLNALDITGYEGFLAILLIPIICMSETVLRLLQTKVGIVLLSLIQFCCLFVHEFPTTLHRLVVMSIGTAASLLLLVANMWSKSTARRFFTCWGLIVSYMLVLATRIHYSSLFPTWALEKTNYFVVTFASIALINRFIMRDLHSPTDGKYFKHVTSYSNNVVLGMGFGTLIYFTLSIFGEASVMLRWIETEQPSWLTPNPWGSLVPVALTFGIFVGMKKQYIGQALLLWSQATVGLMWLYFQYTVSLAFIGGLCFAFFLGSLWPMMLDSVTKASPGLTFTVAMVTYMVEILFSIWTIAYNFVPGGVYTREHTGFLLVAASVIFFMAIRTAKKIDGVSSTFSKLSRSKPLSSFKITLRFVLWWILIFGTSGMWMRTQPSPPANYTLLVTEPLPPNTFTSLIWTFHFGFDNVGLPSFERSAMLLHQTGAEVIALLESDASKPYLGNNDITQWMAERLNMYSDFGPSTKTHTWGNLLLSKYPIVKSNHILLPSPYGELAPAIHATLNIRGQLVDFVTTHMGNDRDNIDRKLQAEYLSNITRSSENPVVFMGYVTSAPGSRDYHRLTDHGKLKDIDDTDYDRWCEYIMYRGLIRQGYARISRGDLSDTELQMAKFEVPRNADYLDNDVMVDYSYPLADDLKFNPIFLPSVNSHMTKHRYHENTPKYFVTTTTTKQVI